MVTAHGRELLLQRSLTDQALLDSFLVKPVTSSMLFDAVIDARSDAGQTHPSHSVRGPGTDPRLQGMCLLLVEDNLNNQQVARELLQDEGAQVQVANHGREAVEALAASPTAFDVVLMDLQMPVMDGFTATKAIRGDLGLLQLPIVAMTANAMASDRQACLDAGMNDHLGKPFDLQHLVQVLRRWAGWSEAGEPVRPSTVELSAEVRKAALEAQVDLPAALQRLGGKQEVYTRVLSTFVRDLKDTPAQLQACAQNGNAHDCTRQLHTLKGLAATLGVVQLSQEAAAAQKAMQARSDVSSMAVVVQQASWAVVHALPSLQHLLELLQAHHNRNSGRNAVAAIDTVALREALSQLSTLLEAADMEAMNAMAKLEDAFADALGHRLEPLQAAMVDLNFAAALAHCKALQAHDTIGVPN
jgi:CheY-like chemotaxis protein/HPt (histidine-containing phosphotransfer) domain-containing protein